jgi:signal peptidase I
MPSLLASCGTLVAVTPLAIWCHDSLFSLCRVRGSSMDPTLFPGDILVVRKADGFWQRWKLPTSISSMTTVEGGDEEKDDSQRLIENDERSNKREQVLAYEREHCNSNGSVGLLRKPPTPLTGNIVVFKDPEKYPDRWNIERVAAIGGETVRVHTI